MRNGVFQADVGSVGAQFRNLLQEHAEHLQELVNEGKLDGAAWQPWHAMAGIAMGCYGAGGYVGVVKFDHGIQ